MLVFSLVSLFIGVLACLFSWCLCLCVSLLDVLILLVSSWCFESRELDLVPCLLFEGHLNFNFKIASLLCDTWVFV